MSTGSTNALLPAYPRDWNISTIQRVAGEDISKGDPVYIANRFNNMESIDNIPTLYVNGYHNTAISPDGRYIANTLAASPFLTIYEYRDGSYESISAPTLNAIGAAVKFSRDSKLLYVSRSTSPYLSIISLETMELMDVASIGLTLPGQPGNIEVSDSGDILVFHISTVIRIYKRVDGVYTQTAYTTSGYISSISLRPQGNMLAISYSTSPYLSFYGIGDEGNLITLSTTIEPQAHQLTVFNNTGDMAIGVISNNVRFYEIGDSKVTFIRTISTPTVARTGVFTSNDKYLLINNNSSTSPLTVFAINKDLGSITLVTLVNSPTNASTRSLMNDDTLIVIPANSTIAQQNFRLDKRVHKMTSAYGSAGEVIEGIGYAKTNAAQGESIDVLKLDDFNIMNTL